jgi:hypothetical protein
MVLEYCKETVACKTRGGLLINDIKYIICK